MYDLAEFQRRQDDYRRRVARVSAEGWKFDPTAARKPVRVTVAQALIALAARLSPAAREGGEGGVASPNGAGFPRNATIA